MKANTVIHLLLGVAVLTAMGLLYSILIHPGQPGLSPWRWALFAALPLIFILVTFAPSLVRRWRGLPAPQPPTPSDVRFFIALVVVLCPVAFFAVWAYGPFGSFVIMLVPIAFILRQSLLTRK